MACALDYFGMETEQLEGAVFQQQDALWELAKQALGYEVQAFEYDPEPELTANSTPNSKRGVWLEPEALELPDNFALSLPAFEANEIDADIEPEAVSIPRRSAQIIPIAEPDAPDAFLATIPEPPELAVPPVEGAGELLELAEVILTELAVPSIVELTVHAPPGAPPDLDLDIHTQPVSYSGSDYSPTAALVAKIKEWLNGGTRMPDAVWSMIIDKAVSAAMQKAKDDQETVLADWAGRGWEFIGGPAHKKIRSIQRSAIMVEQDKLAEVLGAKAKQELENLTLAVSQGTALEGALVDAWNKERMRELAAAKATVKLAVEAIDVKSALIDARTARYLSQAEVYSTLVKQAVLPYKRYALMVDAQGINSVINENETRKYVAEMKNLIPYAKKFAAEMHTLQIISGHNKNLAIRYRTAVAAGAKQYLAVEEAWKGLLARHEIPKQEAERHRLLTASFADRTRAWLAGVELEGTRVRADSASKKAQNSRVEQDLQRFIEEVTAKQAENELQARSWSAYYSNYDDYCAAWSSAIGIDEANQRADLLAKSLDINTKIAKLRESFSILSAQRRLQIEQEGGNAQIKTDLSAAMYNVIHVTSDVGSSIGIATASTCETTDA